MKSCAKGIFIFNFHIDRYVNYVVVVVTRRGMYAFILFFEKVILSFSRFPSSHVNCNCNYEIETPVFLTGLLQNFNNIRLICLVFYRFTLVNVKTKSPVGFPQTCKPLHSCQSLTHSFASTGVFSRLFPRTVFLPGFPTRCVTPLA